MFPDSDIVKSYAQEKTKTEYLIKFGIAPYVREKLMNELIGDPYTFKFDETTTSQVKKQYDAYLQFWNFNQKEVVNAYIGSLFVGHCTADNLVDHFTHFMKELKLDPHLFLSLGMDGPNVNLSFKKKVRNHLEFYFNTNFLNIGTCSLHPAHTAYRKGLECLSFDADGFFCDLHFFFKLSSARREDYRALQEVTNAIAQFMLRHISSRWLTIKDVAVRDLEQYPNLREYFLRALPKQKGFKQLQKTDRYQRITKLLKDPLTQFYIAFCAFSANEFHDFLVPFQSNEPKIHLLFPSICKLVSSIMMKYMKKRVLSDDHCENVKLCETDKQNQKGLNLIDVKVQDAFV